jgi:hypothetical protein
MLKNLFHLISDIHQLILLNLYLLLLKTLYLIHHLKLSHAVLLFLTSNGAVDL